MRPDGQLRAHGEAAAAARAHVIQPPHGAPAAHPVEPEEVTPGAGKIDRDSLDLIADDDSWIIRHRDKARIPLRLRRAESVSWVRVEPTFDDATQT